MNDLRHTMTDPTGAFRFEGVPEGSATLQADRPGFLNRSNEASATVEVNGNLGGIVLKLAPQAEIAGYVRSIEGKPIEGFPIRIYSRNIVDGNVQWENAGTLTTGDDGYFRLFGMWAESVIVSGGPERWRERPLGINHLGYPLVFYPNVKEFSAAHIISVPLGEQIEVDFSLNLEPVFEISGQVDGVPASVDSKVELSSSSGESISLEQRRPERHDFSGYVTEGSYTLRASAEIEGQLWQTTMPLEIASNTAGIHLILTRRPIIPVKVVTDFDRDSSHVLNGVTVTLVSKKHSLIPIKFVTRGHENRDQTALQIAGAEPGTYTVEISSYGGYVKAASSGQRDLLRDDFMVPEDGRIPPIEILLSKDGGKLNGTVNLPNHKGSAMVLLIPEPVSAREIRTAMTNADGVFEFEQVKPGNYALVAFDTVDELEYKNADVLDGYTSNAVHVIVPPRQSVRTSLPLTQYAK